MQCVSLDGSPLDFNRQVISDWLVFHAPRAFTKEDLGVKICSHILAKCTILREKIFVSLCFSAQPFLTCSKSFVSRRLGYWESSTGNANKNTNSIQILLKTKCFVGQFYINMFSVRNLICRMRVRGFVTSPHPSTSSTRSFFSSTFASFKSSDLCLSTCFFRWQDLNWLQKNAFTWSVHFFLKKGGKSERFKPKRNIVQKKMKN